MTSEVKDPTTTTTVSTVRALARVARHLERATGELSLPHYRVLAAIDAGSARASRVAARLALGKPTISTAIDALCQRGLVERRPDTTDQRVVALMLTDAGRRALAAADAAMASRLAELCRRAGDAGRLAHEALHALDQALDLLAAEREEQRSE